jgi:hypothetical protein
MIGRAARVAAAVLLAALAGCGSESISATPAAPGTDSASPNPANPASTNPASTDAATSAASQAPPNQPDVAVSEPDFTALPTSPDGLAAALERYREDDLAGTMQVQVVNRSGRAVSLSELRFDWSGMEPQPANERAYMVSPGQVLDIPVLAGPAVCTNPAQLASPITPDAAPPKTPALARAQASFDGQPPATVEIPVTDTRGVLRRLFGGDCRRQSITSIAGFAFDPTWSETNLNGQPAALGTLRLARTDRTEPLVVSELRGSVLLRLTATPAPALPARLEPDQADLALGVVVTQSGNCQTHALAESKHTFLLSAVVAAGDSEPVVIVVIPDDAAKRQLGRLINRACGTG